MAVAVAAIFLWLVKLRGSPVAARRQRLAAAIPGALLLRRRGLGRSRGNPVHGRGGAASPKNTTPTSTSTWPGNGATPSPWNRSNLLNQSPGNLLLFALLGAAVYFGAGAANPHPGTLVGLVLLTPSFMGAIQAIGSWRITKSQAWPALTLVDEILTSHNAATVVPDPATGRVRPAARDATTAALAGRDHRWPRRRRCGSITSPFLTHRARCPTSSMTPAFPCHRGRSPAWWPEPARVRRPFSASACASTMRRRGTIELNGTPHTELDLSELRRRVALMSRDARLLPGHRAGKPPAGASRRFRRKVARILRTDWDLAFPPRTAGGRQGETRSTRPFTPEKRSPADSESFSPSRAACCATRSTFSWMSPRLAWRRKRSSISSGPCAAVARARR